MSTEEITGKILERIKRLEALPGIRRNDAESRPDYTGQIKDIECSLKMYLMDLEDEAGMEKNDDGKLLYTNAAQRENRARAKAQKDAGYQQLIDSLHSARVNKGKAERNTDELRQEQAVLQVTIPALKEILSTNNIEKAITKRVVAVEVNHV